MNEFDFDLFVIGGGSGGVRAARISSEAGARVALAEEFRFGGTCVIRGCVPKKLMVYASGFRDAFEDAAGFGWNVGDTSFDWPAFISAKDAEITRLESIYQNNLAGAKVQNFRARAEIVDAHRVRLSDGSEYSCAHILVATGGRPFMPDIPGVEHCITSNEIFDLPEQPKSMIVVGGGYIACEFAGIMNGLGTRTVQIYRGEQILRGFDDDIRDHIAGAMRDRGVDLRVQSDVREIRKTPEGLSITLVNGDTLTVDQVMYATGRTPYSQGLGLESVGVDVRASGAISVDEWSQTSVPSIYAVGDVTDRAALTPVAIREGHAFADTVFGNKPARADHSLIPTAVFTRPECGTVGLTEAKARENGAVDIYRSVFKPMASAFGGRSEKMLMKLIVDRETQKVVGCHVVGPGSGEMIQLVAIPMRMGATKADFDRTMAVHPTSAEELVTMRTPVE